MSEIISSISDHILLITINRPKALNALKPEIIDLIGQELKNHENDSTIYGIIITGSGEKAFAAGADIKGFPELDQKGGKNISAFGHKVFDYIESYPKPIVAAVNGFALGGGCELAMSCHLRIAAENAVFGMPEVKLGLIPGYGGTQRLIQLIGKAKALEYVLTGEMIDATTALRLGLANHVVPINNSVSKASDIINKIASNGPLAVSSAIKVINSYFDKDTNGFDLEIETFGELMASQQCKEGVSAFLEKRKAVFKR